MTQATGNDHPRVVVTINRAIELARNEQIPKAVQLLRDLAAGFPTVASAHGYLGWFLLQMGRNDEAIQHSHKAVALSPRSETASLIYFHVLWNSGHHIQAIDEMKRFLSVCPSEEYTSIIKEWNPYFVRDQDSKRERS